MPIKYFCDECGKEVPEPYCLYTMGVIICSNECQKKFEDRHRQGNTIVLPASPYWTYTKKWDGDRFPKLNDNNSMTYCNHDWVIVVISPFTQRCTKCGMER